MFSTMLYFIGNMFKKFATENDILLWMLVLFLVSYAFKLLWSLIGKGKF